MKDEELQQLVEEMSLQEKADQLLQLTADFYNSQGQKVITGPMADLGITDENVACAGSVLNGTGAERLIRIQDRYLEKQPHHIPLLFMMDVIHGYRTIFPAPIGQGASFDPELVQKCAAAAAAEASAAGIHVTFSPMTDLVRDPRWGRVVESTGEDPYLNSRMCEAMVKGYQGDDMAQPGKICACIKHFAGYGGAEAGREYNSVQISEHSFREYCLPSYQAGIDAGAGMVMTSFNTVNDIPASVNQQLMRGILRQEMHFDGVLISDYSAIAETICHGVSENEEDAARKALLAGVDIDMMTGCYARHLSEIAKKGEIEESLLNESVLRVLRLKNRLGLFENPHKDADPVKEKELILCDQHRNLARRAAAESCVLLKNNGVLPLKKDQKIAFIGPYIDDYEINSSWAVTGQSSDNLTIRQAACEALPDKCLTFCHGSSLLPQGYSFRGFAEPDRSETFFQDVFEDSQGALEEAVRAAAEADTVVLCVGEHYLQTGEATSRTQLCLPQPQMQLLRAVTAVNPNTAIVLFGGRPLMLQELSGLAGALLEVWMPGTEGAHAILDLLTGRESPSGKLPMSFPVNEGQIPVYYNQLPTGRPQTPVSSERFVSKYTDTPNEPLYPFGYGLSYTEFSYGPVTLSSLEMTSDSSIKAAVILTNTGKRTGTETVQLYLRDRTASVSRPVRELKGFRRVTLKPGESASVTFQIDEPMLRFHRLDGSFGSEPGVFQVWIGGSSAAENTAQFVLIKQNLLR